MAKEIAYSLTNTKIRLNYTKLLVFISLTVLFFGGFGGIKLANAATLYFSPSSGSYTVGQTITVGIYVSSADQAMNASQAIVSFPAEKLNVQSISRTGSIFTLWVQDPTYSNADGVIQFAGIVPNPGFIGQSGKILSVTFKAMQAGEARLSLSKGSVLANDGLGTQILTNASDAVFSIYPKTTEPTAPESITPTEIIGAPLAPIITSPTHPNPDKWYSNSNPKFMWLVPADITAVRILYNKIPNVQPSVIYTPVINEKQLNDIKDEIWYFHVQFKNSYGWGAISHFRFQIDTEPPMPFLIKFVDGNETDNPQPAVAFKTTDSLSGVDYYKVKIGEGDFFMVPADIIESGPYTLPLQNPGKKTILVQAFDKANNYSTASNEFIIKPINPPIITEYPKTLERNEILTVKGKTYPNIQVVIWLQREKEEPQSQIVKSDEAGNFIFVAGERLKDGIYKLWAEAIDGRGAKSYPSEQVTIVVEQLAFLKIGSLIINFLAVIIPLAILLAFLVFIIWYSWHKLFKLKKEIKKEVHEVEVVLHKAFDFLKEEMQVQIKVFEKTQTKRRLTEEEEKLVNRLKKDLDAAEKLIRKEIEDVRKEVE